MKITGLIEPPPGHPYEGTMSHVRAEISNGIDAAAGGNSGRARVCARRAVGALLQAIAAELPGDVGTHAMANLRWAESSDLLPDELREAARRLLGGARAEVVGEPVSSDPLADAIAILNYFVLRASASPGMNGLSRRD